MHLGLGSFFRAHQCVYTAHAPDAEQWGIAAFAGSHRGLPLVRQLTAQDGRFTVVTRGPEADGFETVGSLVAAHPAADHEGWLARLADPAVALVTLTVTEAGYRAAAGGGLDGALADVAADLLTLTADVTAAVTTAPARLVAGLAARRRADGGPIALVPCDNLPANGDVLRRVLVELAEAVDPGLATWLAGSVSVVSTVVDRITPRSTAADAAAVLAATGVDDRCPVVTEPYSEWVLSGAFPAGRPRWEAAGATVTDDLAAYSHRKLWLLNGAHSLLAYAGPLRGHATVDEAVRDDVCLAWLHGWWACAAPHLGLPADAVSAYVASLLLRFGNARMGDALARIAADGSQKLPARVLPVLAAERAAGRLPAGATRVLAAWVCHLRGLTTVVSDPRAAELVPLAAGPLPAAARAVLAALSPELGADAELVAAVTAQAAELAGWSPARAAPPT